MNHELTQKLHYSFVNQKDKYPLPQPLIGSLSIISNFFANHKNNKLCLVFPSKEYAAQWLTVPIVLELIENDYANFKSEIFESYRKFIPGDKLILNNQAIVEWVSLTNKGATFRTKAGKECSGADITIKFSDVIKLREAPSSRTLSSINKVKEALPSRNITPLEKLLKIDTFGNDTFIKNKVCLISKYKSFYESHEDIEMNSAMVQEYIEAAKIDENGQTSIESPLLISNNLSNLALYVTVSECVSKIIIDGFVRILERGTDFSDIDVKKIPTILITDLSEIDSFENIRNFGFEFLNFTKENLRRGYPTHISPFHSFENKLNNYISFNLVKEICVNLELESITKKIHNIEKDESNDDLNNLKISLIQLTNLISRVAHILTEEEILKFNSKISNIQALFYRTRMWLGESHIPIEESILLLRSVIEKFSSSTSEKSIRLKHLLDTKKYDFIICPTEDEAKAMSDFINTLESSFKPQIISVVGVNDSLLANKSVRVILTGWAKSNNMNRILSSFLFSEITVLFYQFENKYYNSLQRRNKKYSGNVKTTIDNKGIHSVSGTTRPKGYDDLYSNDEIDSIADENSFDILDFELKLDNAQYSKFKAKGNLIESTKAKRIDFENGFFIYSSESHKLLVINELVESAKGERANLYQIKVEAIKPSDVIALINTDRDILVELVEKITNPKDLTSVKMWTELWKNLLKEYYVSIGHDFKKLVDDLRIYDCKKHEGTIRAWLQDEARIGPHDDADLISIAMLSNSSLLIENIGKVRESISKMVGWRMKASDFIKDKIKAKIYGFADSSIINSKILVEELGSVFVFKVVEVSNVWEDIDVKYVNRLLQKEII